MMGNMLSYQHIYHAGNFADVQKHTILIRILKTLLLKPTPLHVLDTHAGRGLYDLSSQEAQKTNEYKSGIASVVDANHPPLKDYQDIVKKYKPLYPGTSAIARAMIRKTDTLTCIEKHPGEFEELKKNISTAALLDQDGFQALTDMVPPKERRGLVIVDPSYEIKTEYEDLAKALTRSWKKWPQGVYMVWYPILKDNDGHTRLLERLSKSGIKDILISEISCSSAPGDDYRMTGSGILIINPPWPAAALRDLSQAVANALPLSARSDVFWLHEKKFGEED